MRKAAFITSALLFCSPAALMADGYSADPRLDVDAQTEVDADATFDNMNMNADAEVNVGDLEADARLSADVDTDRTGDIDVDVDANADVDADTNLETDSRLRELDRVAESSLRELRNLSKPIANLADRAYGYAVFDSTKGGLVVTGTGGTGVAVNSVTGEKTYMRVGGAGLALGGGLQTFKLVLLFETEQDFEEFTNGDWNGNAAAQAVIGDAGANATADFEDGVAAFQFNQKGLMAQADISGLKFWVADSLESNS